MMVRRKNNEAPKSINNGDVRKSLAGRLPSHRSLPLEGKVAPKGRIGHKRDERQLRKAEQLGTCGEEARVPDRK